jgi:hypothetical protein
VVEHVEIRDKKTRILKSEEADTGNRRTERMKQKNRNTETLKFREYCSTGACFVQKVTGPNVV